MSLPGLDFGAFQRNIYSDWIESTEQFFIDSVNTLDNLFQGDLNYQPNPIPAFFFLRELLSFSNTSKSINEWLQESEPLYSQLLSFDWVELNNDFASDLSYESKKRVESVANLLRSERGQIEKQLFDILSAADTYNYFGYAVKSENIFNIIRLDNKKNYDNLVIYIFQYNEDDGNVFPIKLGRWKNGEFIL